MPKRITKPAAPVPALPLRVVSVARRPMYELVPEPSVIRVTLSDERYFDQASVTAIQHADGWKIEIPGVGVLLDGRSEQERGAFRARERERLTRLERQAIIDRDRIAREKSLSQSQAAVEQPETQPVAEPSRSEVMKNVRTNADGAGSSAVATKPAKKKAAKKAAKPAAKKGEKSIRQRVFELLAKGGQTGAAIQKKLDLGGIPSLLKDEALCSNPRIRRQDIEGSRGVVYELTAKGKSDLGSGKVDENAAPSSSGKSFPKGK